ncbi:unnamed protein product [Arabidopsis halleri]
MAHDFPPPSTVSPQTMLPASITHAFNTMALHDRNQFPWYMDTGATNHITSHPGNLRSISNSRYIPNITVGNGSSAAVTTLGQGTILSPSRSFQLQDVLVCPSIIKNLISVRKFVTDNSCSVEFDPFGFCIKDLHTRTKLLRCNSPGPLYSVQPSYSSSPAQAFVSTTDGSLWHNRLGHTSNQSLSRVLSSSLSTLCNNNDLTKMCRACQLGKHVRQPFSLSNNKTQFNSKIKSLQCDNGGEYDNRAFKEYMGSIGATFRFSCSYTSQQNGKAERMLRTINNMVRTLLIHAGMPHTFWVEALHTAVHLLNILPSSAIDQEIPYTKLFKKEVNYQHLRIFGCLCYPNVLSLTPHKLAPRSTPCVLLGYPTDHRGYRYLEISTQRVILSRHVTFDDSVFPFKVSPSPVTNTSSTIPISPPPIPRSTPQILTPPPPPPPPIPLPSTSSHSMQTRSKSGIVKPRTPLCLHTDATISPLPASHVQAAKDGHWNNAMTEEYNAQIKNGMWVLVPRPVATNIIRFLWLFRHKFNADGSLSRYKARLVANGKSQQLGIDCDETFSPVVKPATIRTVLSVATSRDWPLHQLDVKNAFLHGDLDETIYMHQPPGFVDPSKPDHVCLLKRSLYGLKQAPRVWYNRFATFARKIGFKQSISDASLFIFQQGRDIAYLLLYVDDIVLTASASSLLQQIITNLKQEFDMTDLGALHHFLGISVSRDPTGLFLTQQNYAADILHRANMTNCNPCSTPAATNGKLEADSGKPVDDPTLYRSLAVMSIEAVMNLVLAMGIVRWVRIQGNGPRYERTRRKLKTIEMEENTSSEIICDDVTQHNGYFG